jgi:hypothetical protein
VNGGAPPLDGAPLPDGPPLAIAVEGILDGRVGDPAALADAVRELGAAGAGEFRCDVQGGRFSLLPVDTRVPGGAFDAAAQARFLDALQRVVAAAAPGSVESNLRCRLVHARDVAETLFVVRADRVEPLTRVRPRTPTDDAALAPGAVAPPGLGRRELLLAGSALLVAGGIVAWRSGWVDRVLAARAEGLRLDSGPFADMLALAAERAWGDYRVSLRRGAGYPATPQALDERVRRQDDHVHRAACTIVGDGRDVVVQLLDAEQHVLAEVRAELRPLLADAAATVTAKLPGHMRAASVRLSVNAERKPQ